MFTSNYSQNISLRVSKTTFISVNLSKIFERLIAPEIFEIRFALSVHLDLENYSYRNIGLSISRYSNSLYPCKDTPLF